MEGYSGGGRGSLSKKEKLCKITKLDKNEVNRSLTLGGDNGTLVVELKTFGPIHHNFDDISRRNFGTGKVVSGVGTQVVLLKPISLKFAHPPPPKKTRHSFTELKTTDTEKIKIYEEINPDRGTFEILILNFGKIFFFFNFLVSDYLFR